VPGLRGILPLCVLSSPGRFLAGEKLVLPAVPRLKFARGVLPKSSPLWQQPGRSAPLFPGASVHQVPDGVWCFPLASGCAQSAEDLFLIFTSHQVHFDYIEKFWIDLC